MADDLDQMLDRAQADGKITTDDADEVRTFATFLTESGPKPGQPGHDSTRWWNAYHEHYPEEAALVANVFADGGAWP